MYINVCPEPHSEHLQSCGDELVGLLRDVVMACGSGGVEGGVAMIVIDVMPPMATSVKAMHRGDNLLDYHHIDSIAY